jgi:hypothetical protein
MAGSIPRNKRLAKLNKHINFKKESAKSSARKRPTEVTCCACKKRFILAFKPRNPQVYCDECFKTKNKNKFAKENKF